MTRPSPALLDSSQFVLVPHGINARGDVVGVYLDQNWQPHPFIAPRGGVTTDLNAQFPGILRVHGINSFGQLTGSSLGCEPLQLGPRGQRLTTSISSRVSPLTVTIRSHPSQSGAGRGAAD